MRKLLSIFALFLGIVLTAYSTSHSIAMEERGLLKGCEMPNISDVNYRINCLMLPDLKGNLTQEEVSIFRIKSPPEIALFLKTLKRIKQDLYYKYLGMDSNYVLDFIRANMNNLIIGDCNQIIFTILDQDKICEDTLPVDPLSTYTSSNNESKFAYTVYAPIFIMLDHARDWGYTLSLKIDSFVGRESLFKYMNQFHNLDLHRPLFIDLKDEEKYYLNENLENNKTIQCLKIYYPWKLGGFKKRSKFSKLDYFDSSAHLNFLETLKKNSTLTYLEMKLCFEEEAENYIRERVKIHPSLKIFELGKTKIIVSQPVVEKPRVHDSGCVLF